MHRVIFLLTLFSALVFSQSFKEDKNLEIISKNISMEDNIVTATGDVIVYSPSRYITADKLIYDKEKATMELFGNVNVVQDGENRAFAEYLFIDTKKDLKVTKPLMMLEDESDMWFNVKQTNSEGELYHFDNTILSSCDCIDPAWNLAATSGTYDTKEKWVNTYNTTLFIKGIPVLYTPYFGFSTDKTRRSGLLTPTIGYSSDEGILYAQPIYYAPSIDWDLEFIPQIRTNRGYGYETKLRYADSAYSKLDVDFGTFHEKDNYYVKQKLKNKKHNGWNIQYNRSKVFSNSQYNDGLKINLINMNDVDYQTTKYNDNLSGVSNKTITSMIKYYYNTNKYYGDIELKKVKDLSKDNSDDILATLPKINLHKYTDSLLSNDITYSIDWDFDRQTRKTGLTADTTAVTIPVTYTNSFFDDYLEFSIGEELNLTQVDYQKNNTSSYQDGKYATLTHIAKVQTNLLKPYDEYLHTVNLSATFKKPEEIQEKGDLYSINTNSSDLSIFPVTKTNESFLLSLNSSLYEKETLSHIINYKISQLYTYNKVSKSYEKGDLAQNLRLHFGDFILGNDLSYSHNLGKIVLSSTTLDYKYKQAYFNTYYQYSKDKTTFDNQEDLVYTIGYNFDNNYSISYKEEIDLSTDISKRKEYIFGIDKKCWALSLKLADNVVATDTVDNSVQRQKIVYLEFNLKQLFNMQQKYKTN